MPEEIKEQREQIQNTSEVGLEKSHFMAPSRWRKKLSLHKWKIFGVILGALVLAGLIFGILKCREIGEVQFRPQPSPAPVATGNSISILTSDWRIYSNQVFSIKLPLEMKKLLCDQSACWSRGTDMPTGARLTSILSPSTLTEMKWTEAISYLSQHNLSYLKRIIDEREAIYLFVEGDEFVPFTTTIAGPKEGAVIRMKNDDWVSLFVHKSDDEYKENLSLSQEDLGLFGLILSTFKFLPSTISGQGEESCGGVSLSEAKEIALGSECVEQGNLTGESVCNETTGTWWLDLAIDRPGCAPACVVDVSTKNAEINWRCTGLIPSEDRVYCQEPRPEICTMECIVNPPYICGSDGKSYCTECQACSHSDVEWYVVQEEPCGF